MAGVDALAAQGADRRDRPVGRRGEGDPPACELHPEHERRVADGIRPVRHHQALPVPVRRPSGPARRGDGLVGRAQRQAHPRDVPRPARRADHLDRSGGRVSLEGRRHLREEIRSGSTTGRRTASLPGSPNSTAWCPTTAGCSRSRTRSACRRRSRLCSSRRRRRPRSPCSTPRRRCATGRRKTGTRPRGTIWASTMRWSRRGCRSSCSPTRL